MFTTKFRPLSLQIRQFHKTVTLEARNIKPYPLGIEGQFRKGRSKKIIKVPLPDFEEMRADTKLKPEEFVTRMKEKGVAPPRKYRELPISVTSLQGVLDPYIPPEGDGKFSILSKSGAAQKALSLKQKGSSLLAIRKLRSYEDDFDLPTFCEEALQIYIKVHELVASQATEELLDYVTDFAYPVITFQRENKTIKWQFVKSNELPVAIQTRTQHLIEKENMFAQITVRFNTRQILAIYDRFGHLMHGSEAIVKDVLEYVVFEKNISDYNARWRLHAKIVPTWTPKKEPIVKTFLRGKEPEGPTAEEEAEYAMESGESKDKKKEKIAAE